MKLLAIAVEATPQELEMSPAVQNLLERISGVQVGDEDHLIDLAEEEDEGAGPEDATVDVPGVPADGQAVVQCQLAKNPAEDMLRQFLDETTGWPAVAVLGAKPKHSPRGTPHDYARYIRMRKTGSRFGGFAYVWPARGRVDLRLSYDTNAELEAVAPAAVRTHGGHQAYRVTITVVDESTLHQAVELARLAYDLT